MKENLSQLHSDYGFISTSFFSPPQMAITPLKPQHSSPNPLANQFLYIDFLTPPTLLIIPHRLATFLESLMPLKN